MKRSITVILFSLICATAHCIPCGFQPLFNGDNADGWSGGVAGYEFADGVIQALPGKGGTIYTEQEYADFIVQFEFKLPAGGNSGVAIRYPGRGDPAYSGMCELQILDDSAARYKDLDARQYHGSAYGMTAAKRGALKPVGEWNAQIVTVQGSTITVELNGELILDTDLSLVTEYHRNKKHSGKDRAQGHLGFAGHRSSVAFRNIFIKEL